MKKVIATLLFVFLCFGLCSCGSSNKNDKTDTSVSVSDTVASASETETAIESEANATTKKNSSAASQSAADDQTEQSTKINISVPDKTGDMIFTDDAENKFIAAVSSKYNIDSSLLACIYTTAGNDVNYVWQFDGTKDSNGKLIRNTDTLKYVYGVSQDCKTIKRTAGLSGNIGYSAGDGIVTYEATKQLIMPKFEEQLNS